MHPLLIVHLLVAFIIVAANFFAGRLVAYVPGLPEWIVPLASVLLLLILSVYQWHSSKAVDDVKYHFVYVVTHKFRTPLTSIKWATETLKKDQVVLQTRKDEIQQIDDAADRLVELVDILVGATKVDTEAGYIFKAVALREIVDNILLKYSHRIHQKNIKMEIAPSYGLPLISVDVKRIEFVIQILLENALAYTPAGGGIGISFAQQGNKLIMAMRDTGIGIPKQDQKNLFKAFYRAKAATAADTEGVGMGLFIARKIIERHRGRIWLTSDGENQGTTAYVEFRLA